MEIDKKTIMALSSDSRLDILKMLKEQRMLPSEISKKIDLAPSTISEHLKKLENANLIKREERGAKWVYYNLTPKGKSLIQPKIPVQFILILSIGLIFVFGGLMNLNNIFSGSFQSAKTASSEMTAVAGSISAQTPTGINWLVAIIVIVGIILITYAFLKKK
ncbi:MAG: winged helix-turn-helix domain-containing protein [Nanoarchaeota archaeon]|nr:winged helix-turn-helix domain-containing protein [Nanoarchaeota archaeon]MBU4124058.1 winged helix-turn-helix domain-containing protein [Nanoarchaeota archaeon]